MPVYARVTACRDILTPSGLCIAKKGEPGYAAKGARPHELINFGKMLIYFSERDKGYWCNPALLRFTDKRSKLADFVAVREIHDPYADALAVPFDNVIYTYNFGNNLKLCREARKFSQADLGRKMGEHGQKALAQSTICYRERCQHSPGGQFVEAAAKALQVPAFIFFIDLGNCRLFDKTKSFLNNLSSACCNS